MKLDKQIFCFLKIFLIAYLMISIESKVFSRSSLALKRYQKNLSMIRAKFSIDFQDVLQLSLGIIFGFVKQKYEQIKTALKITKELGELTINTFNSSFSTCLQKAKEDSQPKSAEFEAFISVMRADKRDTIMTRIIKHCTEKNEDKIEKETLQQINRINKVIKGDGLVEDLTRRISNNKNKKKYIVTQRKVDLDSIKKILSYFNQEDRNMFSKAFFSVKRTVCDYLEEKNENWFNTFKRYLDYSISLLSCGGLSLAKEFFGNNDKYQESFKQLLIKGFNAIYKIKYLVLIKFVWNFFASLLEGNSSYFAAGEGLGKELADNINLLSLLRRKY